MNDSESILEKTLGLIEKYYFDFCFFFFQKSTLRRSCYALSSCRNDPSQENAFSLGLLQFFSWRRLLQFSNFPAGIVPLDKRQPVSKRNIYQSSLALLLQLLYRLLYGCYNCCYYKGCFKNCCYNC